MATQRESDTHSELFGRISATEKEVATIQGQLAGIAKAVNALPEQIRGLQEAFTQQIRENREAVRHEVDQVRSPKGQWVQILAVCVSLFVALGGPGMLIAQTFREEINRLRDRQYELHSRSAEQVGSTEERRYWVSRELDRLEANEKASSDLILEVLRSHANGR